MGQVLVVDDCDDFRAMLCDILVDAGHEVFEASDGREGMQAYRENPAVIVITDIIMPEKEGIEMIMELRRDFPEIKIIAVSGGGCLKPEDCLAMAGAAGVKYAFEKPIDINAILTAVNQLLDEEKAGLMQR